MRIFKVLIFILLFSTNLYSQDKTVTYLFDETTQGPDYNIKINHLTAELKIDPYQRKIDGKAIFTFTPYLNDLDSISFMLNCEDNPRRDDYKNGTPWKIHSVKINNVDLTYETEKQKLKIHIKNKLSKENYYDIEIDYTVMPVPPVGIYFTGWDDTKNLKRKQIWAHRPFGWLPYYDSRLTVDMYITFDKNFKVFSNGERKTVTDNNNGTNTWYYKMEREHPFFSTALVIGDYTWKSSQTSTGLPLELCYYPDLEKSFEPSYRYTEKMFDFLENEFGFAYPYLLYRETPVIDYLYGAMETTTSTVYGDFLLVDERGYFGRNFVNVNAHELTHQWFGNYLSHLRGRDVWLTESFATYFAKMFEKSIFGDDYYENERNNELTRALTADEKDKFPIGHSRGGTERVYPKGSLMLDMLRNVLGDEEFKLSIKHYLEKNKSSVVETGDFIKAIREATGKSLDWFFEEWLLRGGEPTYKVSYKMVEGGTKVSFSQTQDTTGGLLPIYKMPIRIEVYYTDNHFDDITGWFEKKDEEVIIPNPEKRTISFVLFDPGRKIIKKLFFERSLKELSTQALNAPNMIDRYDALLAMRDFPLQDKLDVLKKCYEKETFHLTKSEIIFQISKGSGKEVNTLLIKAINDQSPLVRKAVLMNVTNVRIELQTEYEKLLKDSAYYNVEMALTNLCSTFKDKTPQYLETTKNEIGWRGRNIRVKWLEIMIKYKQGIGKDLKRDDYLKELIDYSSKSYEFETRINAMNSLKNIDYLDEEFALNLFDAYLNWHHRLNGSAKSVIEYFYQKDIYKNFLISVFNNNKWNNAETKTLKDILK